MTKVFAHVAPISGEDAFSERIGGSGSDTSAELAWLRAVGEAAERYASMAFCDEDFVIGTAQELGSSALDLETLPRCSAREYADPKCPFVRPDKSAPMRWVRGYSLVDDRERLVPAVMVYLYFHPWPEERIWPMISTGTAAHPDVTTALISAICEVIERDAISITWLARLPLPRIELDRPLPADLDKGYSLLNGSLVKQYFFDATSDLGVPTVYALQLLDGHPNLSQFVSCATGFDMAALCAKTIREASPARSIFQHEREIPSAIADFNTLYDGSTFLGRPEHRDQFAFLLETPRHKLISGFTENMPASPTDQLRFLIQRLSELGMDVIAMDITPDEVRELGLWVVRVVIPGLMPMSVIHRGRFLGHPRLYSYPEKAGFGKLVEDDINPAPQPFA